MLRALYKNMPDHSILTEFSLDLMSAELAELQRVDLLAALSARDQSFAPIRLYFREGERTPDGRVVDPNAINFDRPPPYPISLQVVRAPGHDGAIVCGVITKPVYRDGLTLVADGFLDLTLQFGDRYPGQEAFNLLTNRTMQTWSPDLGDSVIDVEENYTDEDPNLLDQQGQVKHIVKASFLGAALVQLPALGSAMIELLNEDGSVLVPAPQRDGLPIEPAGTVMSGDGIFKYITDRTDQNITEVAACAGPTSPSAEFFEKQEFGELQRWVEIFPDGHVRGHGAGRQECHVGFMDRCVTIDMIADCNGNGNFEYAMPGHVVCSDGSKVSTGPIAIKGGHAPKGLGWRESLAHYDDPSAVVADVAYYMDEFGVQFTGAIRPTATEEQVHTLRASGVSLDAREIEKELRYLATCAVNTPGFPKVRARILASAESAEPRVLELVGGNPVSIDEDCGCPD